MPNVLEPIVTQLVPVSLPHYAGTGYGSAMVGVLSEDSVLFTYFEGKAASRLAELDCQSGALRISKGVSGMLMDGVVATERHAYLLFEYALHEYDLRDQKVTRKLKLPKEMNHVFLLSATLLAVSRDWSNVTLLIDIPSWTVLSRLAFPADFFTSLRGNILACSFQRGFAKVIDGTLKPTRDKKPLPYARFVVADSRHVFGIKGPPTPGDVPEPLRATRLIRMSIETFAIEAETEILGVQSLFGIDPDRRLILGLATGMMLADSETLKPVARCEVPTRITAAARVAPRAVAFTGHPQFVSGLSLCRWGPAA